MNSEIDEVVMCGTPDNDYPDGDFVCLCYSCGVDYHGPDETMVCYVCSQIKYEIEATSFVVRPSILIVGYIAILSAILINVGISRL